MIRNTKAGLKLTTILEPRVQLGRACDAINSIPISQFTNAIAEQAAATLSFVTEIGERNTDLRDLCIRLGWPPPSDIGVNVIDSITHAEKKGELTPNDVAALFLELYTPDHLTQIGKRWNDLTWLAERHSILLQGIASHLDGRYFSSTCLLLTQVEGVIGDYVGDQPNPKQHAAKIFSESKLSAAAKAFYLKVASETFKWSTRSTGELARHSIMHGKNVDYGSAANSLKTILILDWVITAIGSQSGT